MKLLTVALHHAIGTPRFVTDALLRLGHDVRHIGPTTNHFGESEYPERIWQPDASDMQHTFPDWMPDLVMYLDSIGPYYHHQGYASVPHIWYYQDGVMDNDMPGMAHYFHANGDSPTRARQPDRFTWLPCAYDPTLHTPSPIPFAEREYDLVHIGSQHPRRKRILQALVDYGFKCDIRPFAFGEDYTRAYWNGRVAISENFANNSVVPRTFEGAIMGNVIVAQIIPDLLALNPQGLIFVDDVEDEHQWIDAVNRALDSADAVNASRAWAQPHTWDARAHAIIETCQARGIVQ